MGQVAVDDTSVTDHGDPLAAVPGDDPLDRLDDPRPEVLLRLVDSPVTVQHGLPPRIVRRLQFLDGHVLGAVLVPLGDSSEMTTSSDLPVASGTAVSRALASGLA